MPSESSAAARFAVTVDLPTPPLPDPTQITFLTAASAPVGSPSWRPSCCWRPLFSWSVRTSRPTFTCSTPPSPRIASVTPFWKCERIGQPGVVSETTTSTRPSAGVSIERTIPRSTMLWRSSGSMTTLSASRICSVVGIAVQLWQRHVVVPRQPVIGDVLPHDSGSDMVPVRRADARIAVDRAEPNGGRCLHGGIAAVERGGALRAERLDVPLVRRLPLTHELLALHDPVRAWLD